MGSLSSNAVSAKARSMYAKKLTQNDYDELLKRRNISDMVAYLKSDTEYANVLSDIKENTVHRGQLEALLNKEYYERTSRLIRYASKSEMEFYKIGVVSGEIELLLNKIRILNSEIYTGFDLDIPEYLASQASFNIYGLINASTYDDILELVKKTKYYDVLASLRPKDDEPMDYNILEIELKRVYFSTYVSVVKKLYRGKKQKDLLTVLYTMIELQNITKIYRLKKYFHATPQHIKSTLFMEYSRMPRSFLEELIATPDATTFLRKLAESSYRLFVDDQDFVYIEYYTEKIKYNLAKRYMRFSTDASLVYMTYSIILNIEVDNLKHIIEGIRYEEPASSIEKMLIY